jgi:hypothetical protein
MACPIAFSTTDISNGNSRKNNAKYRSDVRDVAIWSGLSSKGVRYETIVCGGGSGGGDGWV